ncbi:HEAT repeat domain-containing protein, partial [bacterium]|nr:HEAT repeat domain-containing protein [bacterium]
KDRFTGWLGQKYIWKKGPKNKKGVELMYYASFDPALTGNAVYYGLSVAGDEQSPKVLKRFVDICMSNIYVTRILWGTKGKHDRMIEYLEPYLNSSDQQIRQRAVILEKTFKGEIDYGQWEKEQHRKKRQEEFGDQLPQIREVLLKGNSKQRSEMFGLIRRKGLYILVDDSFKEPLIACLKDDHPVVKEAALRLSGGVLLKKNEQSPDIFELMSNLSRDWDHKVRNEAAKFIGGHWIWGAKPQKPEAIEIMLRLSNDKDRGVRNQAVYYGLSVVEDKDERVVKRLVEMALDKTNDFGRISWGLSYGADKEMIKKYLKPYIDIKSKKGELARQLYKEIFKEELPEI